jgi:hypothetical protein
MINPDISSEKTEISSVNQRALRCLDASRGAQGHSWRCHERLPAQVSGTFPRQNETTYRISRRYYTNMTTLALKWSLPQPATGVAQSERHSLVISMDNSGR